MGYDYPHYIKKNGKYLAYRIQTDEYDFWEVSELDAMYSGGWYWCDDIEHAKCFMDHQDASNFLAKKRGAFWQDSEVKRYRFF